MARESVAIDHEVFRALRKTLGMSRPEAVRQLHEDTGLELKAHSLYQIEIGRRKPSPKIFAGLCKVYGVGEDQKPGLLADEVDRYAMSLRRTR